MRGDVVLFVALACACSKPHTAATADGSAGGDASDAGQVVYDPNQHVYWLADANLAASSAARSMLGASTLPINPDGTMSYDTAKSWVALLNAYDGGNGYLGHNNWQLPVTPSQDPSCAVPMGGDGNSFGPSCVGSALGSLYSNLLGLHYPDSAVPAFANTIGPFHNLLPAFYWSSGILNMGSGDQTFTFAIDLQFQNTTKYNYFPVLPMVTGALGTVPTGTATLLPYVTGPAAGKAVWDQRTMTTWLLDADLARSNPFSIAGTTTINAQNGTVLMPPLIDPSGTMLLSTAQTWIGNMNTAQYAGAGTSAGGTWTLPAVADMQGLFGDLQLQQGDPALLSTTPVGSFQNLQPFFYWACMRDQTGSSTSPCNGNDAGTNPGGTVMDFSFNFASGFQGTDEHFKAFYVIVYYPGP